jgi:hypothetical protein
MEQARIRQQQDLVNLRDKLQADLVEEDQVMNSRFLNKKQPTLNRNKAEYNYENFFGKSFAAFCYTETAPTTLQRKYSTL